MAVYVMLARWKPDALNRLREGTAALDEVREKIEAWEAKILHSMFTLGEYDYCMIFEAPDNFKAYRALLEQDISIASQTEIMPAYDLPLFQRLISQTTETEGPHLWQTSLWAKVVRRLMRGYAWDRHLRSFTTSLTVSGQENFDTVDGPCIVVANHASHVDHFVLQASLPNSVRWNIYMGAAADRWFIKGRKEWTLQPWYQSLVNGSFPINRGGGSAALRYPKQLLDQGANIIVFPEGTRSGSRKLGRFRHGVSIMALEKDVPVVPVYMTGLAEIRPKGSKTIVPGPAVSHILPPLHFASGTTVPEATTALFNAMNGAHNKCMAYAKEHKGRYPESLEGLD